MNKKSVTKNYIYNVAYQILGMIIPFITTPYLSRVLGAENIGIYSYTLSITTYFILFGSLGIVLYGQREIAYVQDDLIKRNKTFYEILFLRFITLIISMILFYFSFCRYGEYIAYYKILLIELFASCIDISWFFQGMEEFKKTVTRNIIVKIVSVIFIFLLVKSPNDLNIYIYIYALSNLLGNATMWFYMPKFIKKVKLKDLQIFRHVKPTLYLFIPQIAIQIYTVLDKTMIGAIVIDKSEVGYYEQAQKIIKFLMTIATSLGTVMMPRIAYTFAKGDKNKLKEYMNKSFSFIMMLAFPLMFGIISVASKFVPLFYGEGYSKVTMLMCIMSPIIVIIGLSNVIGTQYLLPTKQQKKYTISVTVGAVVNIILNTFLIKMYASVGASIATVVAESAVTIIQFYAIRKEISIVSIIKNSYKYFFASIIMLIVSLLIRNMIYNNIICIIVQIIISIIVYFSSLIICKDDFLQYLINKAKKR